MTDIATHYSYLYRILQDIAANSFLSPQLIFKGGTALMFFYDLPRFSVDLDFTLVNKDAEDEVYRQLLGIAKEYGEIADSNLGFYGPKVVLDYGIGEWKLKIEVSNRYWDEQADLLVLDGSPINVMKPSDMYAHKLIALSERKGVANRDIFDIFFFEENNFAPNEALILRRKGISLLNQLKLDLSILENYPQNRVLSSLAPLLTLEKAQWVRTQLLSSTIAQLKRRQHAEELKHRLTLNIPDVLKSHHKGKKRK